MKREINNYFQYTQTAISSVGFAFSLLVAVLLAIALRYLYIRYSQSLSNREAFSLFQKKTRIRPFGTRHQCTISTAIESEFQVYEGDVCIMQGK